MCQLRAQRLAPTPAHPVPRAAAAGRVLYMRRAMVSSRGLAIYPSGRLGQGEFVGSYLYPPPCVPCSLHPRRTVRLLYFSMSSSLPACQQQGSVGEVSKREQGHGQGTQGGWAGQAGCPEP